MMIYLAMKMHMVMVTKRMTGWGRGDVTNTETKKLCGNFFEIVRIYHTCNTVLRF